MKKAIKLLSIAGVLAVIAFVYVWFCVINKPHADYANMDPDVEVTGFKLYNDYKMDPVKANDTFGGKLVLISTPPSKIEKNDSLFTLVWVFESGMFGDQGIRCNMLAEFGEGISRPGSIDNLQIKGYCTGFNDTDVILEKGSVVKFD